LEAQVGQDWRFEQMLCVDSAIRRWTFHDHFVVVALPLGVLPFSRGFLESVVLLGTIKAPKFP
jgi:hypothetical protein